jgi:hypothetical protein
MPKHEHITLSTCSDPDMVLLAVKAAKELAAHCKTSMVLLTSECGQDGHGIHVTMALLNKTGTMSPGETVAACKRLRSLADELEQRFTPGDGTN